MKTKNVHVVVILSLWIIRKEWCDKVTFSVKSKMAWEFGVCIFGVGILVCSGAKGLFCGSVRVYVWLYVCLFVWPFFCACVFLCENMYVFFLFMCLYTCIYIWINKFSLHVYMYVRARWCISICVAWVFMNAWVGRWVICIDIYTYVGASV